MAQDVNQMIIICPNCKAQNQLGACLKERPVGKNIEGGLECPDCGEWTHSYWKTPELIERAERVERLRVLFLSQQTEGRWNNYQVARDAYARDFNAYQERHKERGNGGQSAKVVC